MKSIKGVDCDKITNGSCGRCINRFDAQRCIDYQLQAKGKKRKAKEQGE
jgi:hypothetical protein